MIKVLKHFLSDAECNQLVTWVEQNHHMFADANMNGNRKTTRYHTTGIVFPELAKKIREDIKKNLHLEDKLRSEEHTSELQSH